MVRYILALFVSMLLTGCLEGPAGPQGEKGEQGEQGPKGSTGSPGGDGRDAEVVVISGVLGTSGRTNYNTTTTPLYKWDFFDNRITSNAALQIYIRQGSGFAWLEPDIWSMGEGWVRILELSDGSFPLTGYEYKIVVVK